MLLADYLPTSSGQRAKIRVEPEKGHVTVR